MEKKVSVLIVFEDVDGVRVWSGRKGGDLTIEEWLEIVERVARQIFISKKGGEEK